MARHRKIDVLQGVISQKVIPLFYHEDIDTAFELIKACAAGGAKVVEFTNRGDHAYEVFKEIEKRAAKELPEVVLGIGSVIDAPTASLYLASGANFVVGPCLEPEVAMLCNARKIPYMPGCQTLSEIHQAHKLGVDIVKLFPGGANGGASFVAGILAPCPWIQILPTGGVEPTKESMEPWFKAGITACGMGSKLIQKDLVAQKKYAEISAKIKTAIDLANQF